MQKDVALVSLANVLHRSHYSNEAAIVMHAALDVSHDLNVNHFTLGNIYAVSIGAEPLLVQQHRNQFRDEIGQKDD